MGWPVFSQTDHEVQMLTKVLEGELVGLVGEWFRQINYCEGLVWLARL